MISSKSIGLLLSSFALLCNSALAEERGFIVRVIAYEAESVREYQVGWREEGHLTYDAARLSVQSPIEYSKYQFMVLINSMGERPARWQGVGNELRILVDLNSLYAEDDGKTYTGIIDKFKLVE